MRWARLPVCRCAAALLLMWASPTAAPAVSPADVTFAGTTSFSPAQLRITLAEQLNDIATSGLTPARADDAAWFLGSFYRKQGFANAKVSFDIRASHLVLNVSEGTRTLVQSLTFTGNRSFSAKVLGEYMIGVPSERLAEAKLPYQDADVAAGAGRVLDFYVSEGYLNATVDITGTRIGGGGRQADLIVRIIEGQKYTLGEITFTGRPIFPRPDLIKALALKPGAPFTPYGPDEMQRTLQSFYRGKGYFSAKVTASADRTLATGGRVPMTFACDPGLQFRVSKVEPRGMDRLSSDFMEKRFESLTGKVYDPAKLEERYRQLIKTGLFKSLQVRPSPESADTLRLDVVVEEAKAKEVGFELGYGSYDGVLAGVSVGDRNFLGYGRPLSLGIQYSQRGLRGELLYENPWLLDSEWALRARLYSQFRDELGYSKVSTGVRLDLSRRFAKHWEGGGYVVAEKTTVSDATIDEALIGPKRYLLAAVGLTQTIDYRDDVMNPTRGWVLSTSADIDALDGRIAFARASFRYSWYRTFGKSLLGIGARAGWIVTLGEEEMVPIDLRYFNGGNTTVRSFAERRLGPKDRGGNPLGGEFYTVMNAEWDFPIAGALGGAVFADAGSLSEKSGGALGDLRYAIGVGLRYQLPIGPVRLDYGYNPSPKSGESPGAVHFSFGFAF